MATQPFFPEINRQEIQELDCVGHGTYGTVYKALWKGELVAVKHVKQQQNGYIKEYELLTRVKHPNIVSLYGMYTQEPNVCLVMEFAEDGSLYNLLKCSSRYQFTTGHAMSWARQCAVGVAHLHAMKPRPLIHRDLKTMNLLLVKGFTVIKICDFGTVTELKTAMSAGRGTIEYMAPEMFKENKYTEKCDVYSWGIILWEVLSRQQPYKENNQFYIMNNVSNGLRPEPNEEFPKPIKDLMTTCWDQNPANRPTMSDVVEQMLELSKSFPFGHIPLHIQGPFFEEIDHRDINIFSLKHRGTFGAVYKAKWKNQYVAVKHIEQGRLFTLIPHPNIVGLYGIYTQEQNVCLVMEFCAGVSLYKLLYSIPQMQYTLDHAMSWMKQCAEAVAFLHSIVPRPIIHRNLKSLNLLIVNDGTVLKICGFGTAFEENRRMPIAEGIIEYRAPEVLQGGKYNEKCDVYSWGIILLEVLSRLQEFELERWFCYSVTCKRGLEIIARLQLPIKERPKPIENLMTPCCDLNPANRPTMSDVFKQMLELCKSFPDGNIPLATLDSLVEEIDHHEINQFSFVGKGTYGTVYKALWKKQDVAVKYVSQSFPLTRISHPNIVRLYGMCTEELNVCLVMEFCDGVSLYSMLFSKPQIQYTQGHAMSWMKQCADGVAFLHSRIPRQSINWTLKPQNLLLIDDGTVLKICEIGTATKENTLMPIDDNYTAPEESDNTEKCDVYSWGKILLEVLSQPQSVDPFNRLLFLWRSMLSFEPIHKLITKCCNTNPAKRPSMRDVVEKITDLCQSHLGGDTPLVIPDPTIDPIDHHEINTISLEGKPEYKDGFNHQYIAGRCIPQKLNPFNIEYRRLSWISDHNMQRQISLVPIMDRTGYNSESFDEFIHLLNTGDCKITEANQNELAQLAIKFQVDGLENK